MTPRARDTYPMERTRWPLCSLLTPQPQETIIQTPAYSGIFGNKWLRKQKRSELRDFLLSDAVYAIVEGPPGSLKTACVQHVAAELDYTVKEVEAYDAYKEERSRAEKEGRLRTLAATLKKNTIANELEGETGARAEGEGRALADDANSGK